jgi:hypothetical protein
VEWKTLLENMVTWPHSCPIIISSNSRQVYISNSNQQPFRWGKQFACTAHSYPDLDAHALLIDRLVVCCRCDYGLILSPQLWSLLWADRLAMLQLILCHCDDWLDLEPWYDPSRILGCAGNQASLLEFVPVGLWAVLSLMILILVWCYLAGSDTGKFCCNKAPDQDQGSWYRQFLLLIGKSLC